MVIGVKIAASYPNHGINGRIFINSSDTINLINCINSGYTPVYNDVQLYGKRD